MKGIFHQFIEDEWDKWYAKYQERAAPVDKQLNQPAKPIADTELMQPVDENGSIPIETVEKPKDRRVVRAPSSGDKVYLLDEKTMEKRWISSETVLQGLGFSFGDVQEVSDAELAKYRLTQALYEHNLAETA